MLQLLSMINNLLGTLGDRLKSIREEKRISQLDLCKLTGIMREQISRIENGQINLTLETLYKLSVALNISLSQLMDFPLEKDTHLTYKVKPFVKWAGGKTQIMNKIKELMPSSYNTYFEPFLGGGALFFELQPKKAVVADSNQELIAAYQCFQNQNTFDDLVKELIKHQGNHSEEYYYQIRALDRDPNFLELPIFRRAARMIYLNKACFNGLYRVNSKGYFNVPSGKYKTVKAYDQELFENIFTYFSNSKITIMSQDFEKVVTKANKGDFVYFDPPYAPFEEQNNFTMYTKDAFGKEEQKRLSKVFRELDEKGVNVMLSNHNTKFIQELYQNFKITVVEAKRMINANSTGRGNVEEVIITNY